MPHAHQLPGLDSRGAFSGSFNRASCTPQNADRRARSLSHASFTSNLRVSPRIIAHHTMRARAPLPSSWRLWHPRNGIVFAPSPPQGQRHAQPQLQPQPLYPDLGGYRALYSTPAALSEADVSVPPIQPEGGRSTAPHVIQLDSSSSKPLQDSAQNTEAVQTAHSAPAIIEEQEEPSAESEKEPPALEDPPSTTLDFKVDLEAFRAAQQAEAGSAASYWSYTLYRGPEGEKVRVHYCRSNQTTERVCQYFLHEKVIGFDLEWMAEAYKYHGPRRNVCLIQLASQSRVALFHIAVYPQTDELVSPSLRRIMEDPEITKVGVNIKADCTRLRTFLGIDTRGMFELSHLYRLVVHSMSGELNQINRRLVRLAEQVQNVLKLPMFKGQDVRSSDWSKPLRMDQIIYSSSDAYAGVQIYDILEQLRENLNPTPPRPHHAELNLPIRLPQGTADTAADEAVEDVEPEEGGEPHITLSEEIVDSVVESLEVEADLEEIPPPRTKTTPRKKKAIDVKFKDERVAAAQTWAAEYMLSATRPPKIKLSQVRAWHIWHHNPDLDPAAVAALLRDPPIQTTTVYGYILEAVKIDRELDFDPFRLCGEILDHIPEDTLRLRYRTVNKFAAAKAAKALQERENAIVSK